MKAREVKRAKLVAKYAAKKAELKAQGDYEAYQALQLLPKNASRVRMHNRCSITGRPKGYKIGRASCRDRVCLYV